MGHEVHVFTRIGPGQKEYEVIHGVHYHRCPFAGNHSLIQEMHNMSKSMVHSFFECENYSGNFDIIHGHDWHVITALDEIKKARNKKIVWTLHSNQYGRDGNNFHNGGAEAIHGLEWYGTYIADKVITCTEKMKKETQWIHKVPEHKMKIIYNGVNANKFEGWVDQGEVKKRFNIGPLDPMILFIGRMTYQKGPDLLLEAIPDILKDHPQTRFVFVGDGDMKDHLIHRSHELGIDYAVRFTGYVSEDDKKDLLRACDAVCIPSRNEPFGIVVLEAWASGKPVVTMHDTGAGDLVWHDTTGLKVYPNTNSISWGIKNIYSDFEKALCMGRNGRLATENVFDWNKITEKTLEVYRECLS
jgi:glycosyltransferase involved in cell wall biosynthesis